MCPHCTGHGPRGASPPSCLHQPDHDTHSWGPPPQSARPPSRVLSHWLLLDSLVSPLGGLQGAWSLVLTHPLNHLIISSRCKFPLHPCSPQPQGSPSWGSSDITLPRWSAAVHPRLLSCQLPQQSHPPYSSPPCAAPWLSLALPLTPAPPPQTQGGRRPSPGGQPSAQTLQEPLHLTWSPTSLRPLALTWSLEAFSTLPPAPRPEVGWTLHGRAAPSRLLAGLAAPQDLSVPVHSKVTISGHPLPAPIGLFPTGHHIYPVLCDSLPPLQCGPHEGVDVMITALQLQGRACRKADPRTGGGVSLAAYCLRAQRPRFCLSAAPSFLPDSQENRNARTSLPSSEETLGLGAGS